jgi:hypothetical protein
MWCGSGTRYVCSSASFFSNVSCLRSLLDMASLVHSSDKTAAGTASGGHCGDGGPGSHGDRSSPLFHAECGVVHLEVVFVLPCSFHI